MFGDHCVAIVDARGARQDTCSKPATSAPSCNYDNDCDDGFYCNYPRAAPAATAAGVCAGALPANAACDSDAMCGGEQLCVGDQPGDAERRSAPTSA